MRRKLFGALTVVTAPVWVCLLAAAGALYLACFAAKMCFLFGLYLHDEFFRKKT